MSFTRERGRERRGNRGRERGRRGDIVMLWSYLWGSYVLMLELANGEREGDGEREIKILRY